MEAETKTVKARLPRTLHRKLAIYAAKEDITIAAALVQAVTQLIEEGRAS